jgi:hypothetical protein
MAEGDMMRAALILILVILTAMGISAATHESGPLGPYRISFDVNTTSGYKVVVDPPTNGTTSDGAKFTRYYLSVDGDNGYASFIITGYDKNMSAGIDDNKNIVTSALTEIGCDSPKLYPTTVAIDGHQGVLGNCKYPSGEGIVVASYSPDSVLENGTYAGKTDCRFVSTYSWNVTRDMLASLHVDVPR